MKKNPSNNHRFLARLLGVVMLSLALLASVSRGAMAAPVSPGFTVRAILPENQMTEQSYFHLLTPPAGAQQLELEVRNLLGEPLALQVQVTQAHTGDHGVIAYENRAGTAPDGVAAWLRLEAEEIPVGRDQSVLSIEEDVLTLAPNTTLRLPFALEMPEQPLEGHVLGGIVLTKLEEEDEQAFTTSFAVGSRYSYAIAVQLQSQRNLSIQPAFSLAEVRLEERAGFPVLIAEIDNETPLVVSGSTLRVRLYPQGADQEPLVDTGAQRFAMTPASGMDYTVSLPTDLHLAGGLYRVVLDIESQDLQFALEATLPVPDAS